MRVSIVIPAYNEEKRIGKTLEQYGRFFRNKKRKKEFDFEILIVLNGCKDNTLQIVKQYKKKFREIRYLNFKQAGKGFAILEGFKDALKRKNDLIGFVDADLATAAKDFYDLVKNIKEYDGIIASRWLPESVITTKQTLLRRITSRGFNFIVRTVLFMPYKDTQCGAKLFKRKVIESVINKIGITEWAFDIDLLYEARKEGFRIKEYPTVWTDKRDSKLNLTKVPVLMFTSIIRLRLLHSPFKKLIKIYDKMPEWIKFHHQLKKR